MDAIISRKNTLFSDKFSTWATESGWGKRSFNFSKFYASTYQNDRKRKIMFFMRISKSCLIFTIWNPPITDVVGAIITLLKKDTITAKAVSQSRCLWKIKKTWIHLSNEGSGLAFFSTDLRHIFRILVVIEFGVMLRGKGPHKPEFAYDSIRIHSHMLYIDLIEYTIAGDTKGPMQPCFLFISTL